MAASANAMGLALPFQHVESDGMEFLDILWIVAGVGFAIPLLMPNLMALFYCSAATCFGVLFLLIWYGSTIGYSINRDSLADPYVFLLAGAFGAANIAGVVVRLFAAWMSHLIRRRHAAEPNGDAEGPAESKD